MTRLRNQEQRDALAEAVADHFIATGSVRDSLRELAEVTGTSARMMVHHFESRDQLVHAALEVARARQLEAARRAITGAADVEAMFDNAWAWYRRADTRRFFKLFNEVAALESATPAASRQFGKRLGSEWQPMFVHVLRQDARFADDAEPLARLIVATIRGLALDAHNGVSINSQKPAFYVLANMATAR